MITPGFKNKKKILETTLTIFPSWVTFNCSEHPFVSICKIWPGTWQCWRTPLIPELGRQRQDDLCEFQTSLVYRASSRTGAKATQENPVSNKQTKSVRPQQWYAPVIPALWKQKQMDLCEFKASLFYKMISRTATEKPCLKKNV